LQRFRTEDKPPVVCTMYRFCAAAGFEQASIRTIIAKRTVVLHFIGCDPERASH
jgi:hypothetical protein